MIFVDTGFFFALFAKEEKLRNPQARELLDSLRGRKLSAGRREVGVRGGRGARGGAS